MVDTDGDGYGDNEFGTRGDSCPNEEGYSTKDVYGCLDSDSDGWSDDGDAFPLTPSQFSDRDGDGWGDNQSEGAELVDLFPSDGTQWNDTTVMDMVTTSMEPREIGSLTIQIDGQIQIEMELRTRRCFRQ